MFHFPCCGSRAFNLTMMPRRRFSTSLEVADDLAPARIHCSPCSIDPTSIETSFAVSTAASISRVRYSSITLFCPACQTPSSWPIGGPTSRRDPWHAQDRVNVIERLLRLKHHRQMGLSIEEALGLPTGPVS